MKKFINDPDDVLAEALRGIQAAHPELRVDGENRVIYRGEPTPAGKVALVSGGGSGHEPAGRNHRRGEKRHEQELRRDGEGALDREQDDVDDRCDDIGREAPEDRARAHDSTVTWVTRSPESRCTAGQ